MKEKGSNVSDAPVHPVLQSGYFIGLQPGLRPALGRVRKGVR